MSLVKDKILDWLISSDDKGVSSEAMAAALLDKEPIRKWFTNHPGDPSDFNRCLKLLRHAPEAREHLDKVAALSDVWAKIVENWDKLEQCFLDEVGIDWEKGRTLSATKTYEMMKELGC